MLPINEELDRKDAGKLLRLVALPGAKRRGLRSREGLALGLALALALARIAPPGATLTT